jgi:hypothetical protein
MRTLPSTPQLSFVACSGVDIVTSTASQAEGLSDAGLGSNTGSLALSETGTNTQPPPLLTHSKRGLGSTI